MHCWLSITLKAVKQLLNSGIPPVALVIRIYNFAKIDWDFTPFTVDSWQNKLWQEEKKEHHSSNQAQKQSNKEVFSYNSSNKSFRNPPTQGTNQQCDSKKHTIRNKYVWNSIKVNQLNDEPVKNQLSWTPGTWANQRTAGSNARAQSVSVQLPVSCQKLKYKAALFCLWRCQPQPLATFQNKEN